MACVTTQADHARSSGNTSGDPSHNTSTNPSAPLPGAGSYETTEYQTDFTLDAEGYETQTLTHDAAGNLTYDGQFAYTYDAFNRLITVAHAYIAPGHSSVSLGSVITEIHYDALGRRTIKYVKNSADRNCTYHFYYNHQSIIEERDGSDNVLRQNVWGLQYIDELVKTSLNDDPDDTVEQNVEQHYYTLHDTQFNILALVDGNGRVQERYEYTPFGQQICFRSLSSADDLLAMSPFSHVERKWVGGNIQPYGRNPFGFQGLYHDEESGLIHHRSRVLHSRLGRFNQVDVLGGLYPDGMNTYAAYHVMRGGLDGTGLRTVQIWIRIDSSPYGRYPQQFFRSNIQERIQAMLDKSINANLTTDKVIVLVPESLSQDDLGFRKENDVICSYTAHMTIVTGKGQNINGVALAEATNDKETARLYPDNLATVNLQENNDLWANTIAHEFLFHTLLDKGEGKYQQTDIRHANASNKVRDIDAAHAQEIIKKLGVQ